MKIDLEVTEKEMERFWTASRPRNQRQWGYDLVYEEYRFVPLDIFGGDAQILKTDIWKCIYWFDNYAAVKIFCAFLIKNNYKFALTSDEGKPNDWNYALYTNYYVDKKGENHE